MRLALFLTLVLAVPAFAQDAGDVLDSGIAMVADAGILVALPAPPVLNPDGNLLAVATALHAAFKSQEWGKLLFFVVTLLVWASRKFFENRVPWLASPTAAIVKSFLIAFSAMLATSWGAGLKPTLSDMLTAVQVGFAAAGGWSILKALLEAGARKDWRWCKFVLAFLTSKPAPDAAPTPPIPAPSK